VDVTNAIRNRRSVRAFTHTRVDKDIITDILTKARWSPSGGNLQPWTVIVVTGDEKENVSKLALSALAANPSGEDDEYPIYPNPITEPYRSRQFEVGAQLYELMGIERKDKEGRQKFVTDNLNFFGAPVGLFFVIDRAMGRGQWAHMGMFMQSIALIAYEQGLGTCMQEVWALVRKSLHAHFNLGDDQILYCGMSLGYIDSTARVNELQPNRVDVGEFVTFLGEFT